MGKPRRLIQRAGIWHYRRRVPTLFRAVDGRSHVEVSLNTRDLDRAEAMRPQIERAVEASWLAKRQGGGEEAEQRYQGALDLARLEGFAYRANRDLAQGPLAEIMRRLERIEKLGLIDPAPSQALFGGEETPRLSVREGWRKFLELTRDRQKRYSPDQLRRWKAPRLKAVNNLVAVIGDKPLEEVTPADAVQFKAWWMDRCEDERLTLHTAKRDVIHLRQVFKIVLQALQLGAVTPFDGLPMEEEKGGTRASFETAWITGLLAGDALAGLNPEARDVLLAMVETGLRPSEVCGLLPGDIRLEAQVPHVRVEGGPGRRRLKTPYSERDMPLVGVSLEAFRRNPKGFPRYWDKSATLSATVNKYLGERGLLPSDRHSLYSFRHAFQDRLTAVDAPDRVQADLMGHKFDRPRYGEGATLAHKREWLIKVAVTAEVGAARPG